LLSAIASCRASIVEKVESRIGGDGKMCDLGFGTKSHLDIRPNGMIRAMFRKC
jgi:hypothetical protein